MSDVHNVGQYIARMHDKAQRDTIHLSPPTVRRCEFGKHSAPNKGGTMIGRLWACAKCREVVA